MQKDRLMSETPPRLTISQEKDVRVVQFTESRILDDASIAEIGAALAGMIEAKDRPKLVLDFTGVEHLSSAALGMLINVNTKVKQQSGQLRLAGIRPQILEVFVITRLNKLFRIVPTRAEALASFS